MRAGRPAAGQLSSSWQISSASGSPQGVVLSATPGWFLALLGGYPSCVARRTNDTAARLVDHLLSAVPYRQWVLSFPFALRFHLARNPALFGKMVSTFLGIVFAWQRHRGRRQGIADGQTGAVAGGGWRRTR